LLAEIKKDVGYGDEFKKSIKKHTETNVKDGLVGRGISKRRSIGGDGEEAVVCKRRTRSREKYLQAPYQKATQDFSTWLFCIRNNRAI
jgi:hypothetical protein